MEIEKGRGREEGGKNINVYNDKRNGGRFWRTCEYEYTSPLSEPSPSRI